MLRATTWEKARGFRKLRLETALPRALRGPVERRLFAWLARDCAGLGSLLIRLMVFSPSLWGRRRERPRRSPSIGSRRRIKWLDECAEGE